MTPSPSVTSPATSYSTDTLDCPARTTLSPSPSATASPWRRQWCRSWCLAPGTTALCGTRQPRCRWKWGRKAAQRSAARTWLTLWEKTLFLTVFSTPSYACPAAWLYPELCVVDCNHVLSLAGQRVPRRANSDPAGVGANVRHPDQEPVPAGASGATGVLVVHHGGHQHA